MNYMNWLSVVIEEYKTLRSESLASMKAQQSILRFGTAAIAVVIATGFNLWEKSPLPEIIFLLFIPAISYLVLTIWMGEAARMTRAGMFLMKLEEKINKEFGDKPKALTWENWLRKTQPDGKTPQLLWYYYTIISLFLLTALASIGIGGFKVWNKICLSWIIFIAVSEIILFIGVSFFIYTIGKRFK